MSRVPESGYRYKIGFGSKSAVIFVGEMVRVSKGAAGLVGALCAALLAAAGCRDLPTPALASATSLSPEMVEPGDILVIEGSGFLEGPAVVTLDGDFKPAGAAGPSRRTVELDGVAVSEGRVEVRVTSTMMKRLAEEPTRFEGRALISFPEAPGLGAIRIEALLERAAIDLRPTGGAIPAAARKRREAERFFESFGIHLVPSGVPSEIVASAVDPGSAADRAGVTAGDRLLAVDGVALGAVSDVASLGGASRHRFEWITPGGMQSSANLESASEPGRMEPDELAAIIIASCAFGLFLALAAPTRRRGVAPRSAAAPGLFSRLTIVMWVTVPLIVFPAAAVLSRAGLGAALFLAGLGSLGLAGIGLFGGGTGRRRALSFCVHAAALPSMLVLSCVTGSAAGLYDAVASQEASPWGWHAWSSPFAVLAAFFVLASIWPGETRAAQSVPLRAARWLAAIPQAMLLCTYFFGGFLVPGRSLADVAGSCALLALGAVLFAGKTWAILVAARFLSSPLRARDRRSDVEPRPSDRSLVARMAALAASFALAVMWAVTEMPAEIRLAGQVVSTAASMTFLSALLVVGLKDTVSASVMARRHAA